MGSRERRADLVSVCARRAPGAGTPAAARRRRAHQDAACAGPLLPVMRARPIALAVLTLAPACAPSVPVQPSWADVEPILRGNCTHCHGANAAAGGDVRFDFFDVSAGMCGDAALALQAPGEEAPKLAHGWAPLIAAAVTPSSGGRARMPPAPAPALADWERETLLSWARDPVLGAAPRNRPPEIVIASALPSAVDDMLAFTIVVDDPDGESVVGVVRIGDQTRALDGPGS